MVPLRVLGESLSGHGALSDLLVQGHRVPPRSIDAEIVDTLIALEWARSAADGIEPLVQVDSWQGLWLAHDLAAPDQMERETVLGVNNTTRSLAALTPRHRVGRALDLATGPGGLACLLARHANTVMATDLSERACRYARSNAELNGLEIDVRTGDLYEPVVDEGPFDLITANLPFVISPDTAYTFRDGGRDRDHMSRDAVVGAAARLAPGGTAVLMCNWIVPSGEEPGRVPLGWLPDPVSSVVVLYHSVESPADYAVRWNKFLLSSDPASYATATQRWTAAFESWGVDSIANGTLVVHHPADGPTFRRTLSMTQAPAGDGGAHVRRIIENNGWLERHSGDIDLLDAVPMLVGPHNLEQAMRFDHTWSAAAAVIRLDDTAGVAGPVEALATHVLLRVDGRTQLVELITAAADATGLDRDLLVQSTVPTFRDLLATGCLTLANVSPP